MARLPVPGRKLRAGRGLGGNRPAGGGLAAVGDRGSRQNPDPLLDVRHGSKFVGARSAICPSTCLTTLCFVEK